MVGCALPSMMERDHYSVLSDLHEVLPMDVYNGLHRY